MAASLGSALIWSTNSKPRSTSLEEAVMGDKPDQTARRRALHGRQKGHPLRRRQADLVDRLLPEVALDLGHAAPAGPGELFPRAVDDVHLEIGFGGGEHLAAAAESAPSVGFLGCEPFINGVAKLLVALEEQGLANVRIYQGDGRELLDWLPDDCLGRVWLLYPDPWPKRRHWKRRFVNPANLDALARVMRPGAELRFASDWPDYADWTLRHLNARGDFFWTAETAGDWRRPWPGWTGTRYEAKAVREGRTPCYLTFRRA